MSLHDIDWYACINGLWVYASSMGGNLPDRVNDDRYLPLVQVMSYNLPPLVGADSIEINERLIEQRFKRAINLYREYYGNNEEDLGNFLETFTLESFRSSYTEHFIEMARKGFIGYIRYDIDNPYNDSYSFVARPPEDISQNLKQILDGPLPVWLRSDKYESYLRQICVDTDAIDLYKKNFPLWDILS